MTKAKGLDDVRRVARQFLRDLPKEFLTFGRWPQPVEHNLLAADYPNVPDGTYRCGGSEALFTFAGGKLIEVVRAGPDYAGDARNIAIDEIAEAANAFGGPGHHL